MLRAHEKKHASVLVLGTQEVRLKQNRIVLLSLYFLMPDDASVSLRQKENQATFWQPLVYLTCIEAVLK